MRSVLDVLVTRYPGDLAQQVVTSFAEIESNFARRKWKESELDAGHFVEATRRIVEFELKGGAYTPFTTKLPNFTDQVLREYEQASGDEAYRQLIPRVLKSIYNLRNKRGAGHVTGISPNHMDATLILYSSKWVLAELARLAGGLSVPETQELCDRIAERQLEILWKNGNSVRILRTGMKPADEVLVLLYDASPQRDEALRSAVEYPRMDNFRSVLRRLHRSRQIEYHSDGQCSLLPPGSSRAEEIIKRHANSGLEA